MSNPTDKQSENESEIGNLIADLRDEYEQSREAVPVEAVAEPKAGKEIAFRRLPRWVFYGLALLSVLLLVMTAVIMIQPTIVDSTAIITGADTNATTAVPLVEPQPFVVPEQDFTIAPPPLPTLPPPPPVEIDTSTP